MTLNYRFQGQHRSNVKTDLNSCIWFPICSPYKLWRYLLLFSIFICIENPIPTPNFGGFGVTVKHPKIVTAKTFNPQKALPYTNPHLLSHFGHFWRFLFGLWAVALSRKKKSHTTRIFHPLAGAWPLIPDGPNLAGLVLVQT